MKRKAKVSPKDWREARRFRAWQLKQKGWKQRDIAEALGVSDGAVSQWIKKARENGYGALSSRRGGGPRQRLTDAQLEQLPILLNERPQHYDLDGDTWTYSRVAALIRQQFDVIYTPTHVGRILKKLGWSQDRTAGQNDGSFPTMAE
jgi:transposase